ncbi:predicted protein [Coccidioides posadasii str. Silveira]|uniref:Predicted protein n=1 Tax=Coccidioides posadasii (strain RMSCC 757 / Silveira) TaxID=443226 RepID=E9CX80_COCPS|nr:predicted protein [Coccidioides posadasii str. Silveira]
MKIPYFTRSLRRFSGKGQTKRFLHIHVTAFRKIIRLNTFREKEGMPLTTYVILLIGAMLQGKTLKTLGQPIITANKIAPFLLGDGIPHDKIQTRNLLFGVVDSPVNRTPTSEGFQAGPLPLGKPTTPPKHVQNDPVGFPSDPSSGTSL